MSQREVDTFLAEQRRSPSQTNPKVLGINMVAMMRAKNMGYPVDMHHPTLEMRQAYKEEDESALAQAGYSRNFIKKEYPKVLFRRTADKKFEPKIDPATKMVTNNPFVEEVTAKSAEDEVRLRSMKLKHGQSEWCERITDLPEMEDGPVEDPQVTIARLRGQLAGLGGDTVEAEPKRGRGRPRKEESVAA